MIAVTDIYKIEKELKNKADANTTYDKEEINTMINSVNVPAEVFVSSSESTPPTDEEVLWIIEGEDSPNNILEDIELLKESKANKLDVYTKEEVDDKIGGNSAGGEANPAIDKRSGWYPLPNGMICQYGIINYIENSTSKIFPIKFASPPHMSLTAQYLRGGGDTQGSFNLDIVATDHFSYITDATYDTSRTMYWTAIGKVAK